MYAIVVSNVIDVVPITQAIEYTEAFNKFLLYLVYSGSLVVFM